MDPKFIILHHSETSDGGANDWAAIRKWHKQKNGWLDVGYHFGVEMVNGELITQEGRPENAKGAHCNSAGMNDKSLGVCLVGNFDKYPPTPDQLEYLALLVSELCKKHSIPVENVLGHREAQALDGIVTKTCPGVMFNMEEFRKSVSLLLTTCGGQNGLLC